MASLALPLLQAAVAAALWVGLYELNGWAFAAFEHSRTISWMFLPAAVRLLMVLLWGWRGALGLWLGALVTNVPFFGVLTPASLLQLSALNAGCSVLLAVLFTDIWGVRSLADGAAMYFGDLMGTLIVLYGARELLRLGDQVAGRRR